jgi:hypothetical protein
MAGAIDPAGHESQELMPVVGTTTPVPLTTKVDVPSWQSWQPELLAAAAYLPRGQSTQAVMPAVAV